MTELRLADVADLLTPAETRILLFVLDGLGGLPVEPGGPTELEAADTPNLDALAAAGVTGLHVPVAPGVTPGSGPGHLGLFGYDPLHYRIGRGALEALGIGFDLRDGDLAARGNFCTVDDDGVITDRRAGRISTEKAKELCEELRAIELPDVELVVQAVKEHRFLLVLRGGDLEEGIEDTDPGRPGLPPGEARAERPGAERAAGLVREFVQGAAELLADHAPANMITLRGFARRPDWPRFPDVFGLRSLAMAAYPMYRGVAKLVGMDALETGPELEALHDTLAGAWPQYDFAFAHFKDPDKAGEDGDFDAKVNALEAADAIVPRLLQLEPDVVIVTGDHSTPAVLRSHSWHPVPVLLWGKTCRPDAVARFAEADCRAGGLGQPRSVHLMPLALGHAGRLTKFGA